MFTTTPEKKQLRRDKVKKLRSLSSTGRLDVASKILRISVSRLEDLEMGGSGSKVEKGRIDRLALNLEKHGTLRGYRHLKENRRLVQYTIDGIPCSREDYDAMQMFERRCWTCGEKYDWAAWEKLPIFSTGKLITEKTTSDVKICPCGSWSRWTAPAYRPVECESRM